MIVYTVQEFVRKSAGVRYVTHVLQSVTGLEIHDTQRAGSRILADSNTGVPNAQNAGGRSVIHKIQRKGVCNAQNSGVYNS